MHATCTTLLRRVPQDRITEEFINTTRRARFWFSIAFLALTVSVFAWGLGYKLSLYDPPQSSSHLMPAAKLLSKNEQTGSEASAALVDAPTPPAPLHGVLLWWAVLPFVVLLLNPSAASVCAPEHARSWHLRRLPALNSFFFRPPPFLL